MDSKNILRSIYLAIPFGIAMITCFIVNYALDRAFTWSALVAGCCIFAYVVLFLLIFGGKHRILLSFAAIAVLVIPLLFLIEYVSNQSMAEPVYWVVRLGAPIAAAWILACGITILLRKVLRADVWMTAGFGVLAIYMGERITNMLIDNFVVDNSNTWTLSEHFPIIYFGTAAVLIIIGAFHMAIRHLKRSQRKDS